MRAYFKIVILILLGFVLFLLSFCRAKQLPTYADLVLVNGNLVTMDTANPRAQAIAIKGDKILQVGSNEEIKKLIGGETESIDLGSKTVIPGLIDAHLHFMGLGSARMQLNFVGTASKEEIIDQVAKRVAELQKEEWVTGRGWDQNDWPVKKFPTYKDLDPVSPNNPITLRRVDGHASWVNSLALKMAGIDEKTPDPPGGKIIRDPSTGKPIGVLIDRAQGLVSSLLPPPTRERQKEMALLAAKECLSLGLTGIHDAGAGKETIDLYRELIDTGGLNFRIYAMIRGPSDFADAYMDEGPEVGYGDNRLTIRSIKISADGALGSRGAALLEPYSDDPGNRGLITFDEERAYKTMVKALRSGFQVCIHAIGDRANRLVLDLYERAFKEVPEAQDHRFRIEHAQILHPDDLPRFAPLGIIASMQPTHATSDMYWAGDRLGTERLAGAYAWKSLLNTGVVIAGGSDAPVEDANPLWGIYAAITRQDHKGWPEGGWYPEQRVSREEALKMFTINAAYTAFEEETKGTLTSGKLADMVVLSDDIMTIPPARILQAKALMTILGGKVVYKTED